MDAPDGTTIQISAEIAPALVVFREGLDGEWQHAAARTPTSYEAVVHGPYLVTVVCENTSPADTWQTWQVGRTLDEGDKLTAPCFLPLNPSEVKGHMVQAGLVQLGESFTTSSGGDRDFTLHPSAGSHDLIASTDERILVRRNIVITSGPQAPIAAIDLENEGSDLVAVKLAVKNPAAGEALLASTSVVTPTTSAAAPIFLGAVDGVKIAPDAALVANDVQTVAVLATDGLSQRSLRRRFRTGANTDYTLPDPIEGGRWGIEQNQFVASWTKLPDLDSLVAHVNGATTDPATAADHLLDLSTKFMTTTKITRAVIETDIPGYHDEWRVDPTHGHVRALRAEHAVTDDAATSSFTEAFAVTQPEPSPAQ